MSVVLSYMTWNFSPDLTNLDSQDSKKEASQQLGEPYNVSMDEVVTPYQLVYSEPQRTRGMPATDNVKYIINPLKGQRVSQVEHIHREHSLVLPELSDRFLALDFPYKMPLSTYLNQVLNLTAKVPEKFEFDRMLIDTDQDGTVSLYAVSSSKHEVIHIKTNLKNQRMKSALKKLIGDMKPYSEVITGKDTIDPATHVFAPTKPTKMKSYRAIYTHINVDKLNTILFNDSLVVHSSKSGVTTYNNNTGVANYNDQKETYRYTNLSDDEASSNDMHEAIPSTFDFINSHGGFTDDFRLFEVDNQTGALTYQMFLNGMPIFSDTTLNQIKMSWGEKGVFSYARGMLKTNVTIDSGEADQSLPAVESVRASLANNGDIDFEKVTNIIAGYKMEDKDKPNDIEVQRNSQFVPAWYVQYNGQWYKYENGGLV